MPDLTRNGNDQYCAKRGENTKKLLGALTLNSRRLHHHRLEEREEGTLGAGLSCVTGHRFLPPPVVEELIMQTISKESAFTPSAECAVQPVLNALSHVSVYADLL